MFFLFTNAVESCVTRAGKITEFIPFFRRYGTLTAGGSAKGYSVEWNGSVYVRSRSQLPIRAGGLSESITLIGLGVDFQDEVREFLDRHVPKSLWGVYIFFSCLLQTPNDCGLGK